MTTLNGKPLNGWAVAFWILTAAFTLVGVIYAGAITDIKQNSSDIGVLKVQMGRLETSVMNIERSLERIEGHQIQTNLLFGELLKDSNGE